MPIDTSGLPAATASTNEVYYGTRFVQGGRTNYLLDLSLMQIITLIPRPVPGAVTPGNRQIIPKHATDFARYLRKKDNWVAPGIILRAEKPFDFTPATGEESGTQFGAITHRKSATSDLHILDGQHRVLGLNEALEMINADRVKLADLIKKARRNGDDNTVRDLEKQKAAVEKQARRFETEHIPVQVMVEADPTEHRQAFVDIADNAKGITASVRHRFNSDFAVNRALPAILEHPLIKPRIDMERDRLKKESPYFTTVKYITEATRALVVGYDGRVGKRMEATLSDKQIAIDFCEYLDALIECFPPIYNLNAGQITAQQLRDTSLLGSPVFLRILAAVWHDLTVEHSFTPKAVKDFFKSLAPHLGVPIHENSMLYVQIGMPAFLVGMSAPSSRRQDAAGVTRTLVDWAIEKPAFVTAEPKPAPKAPAPKTDDELTEEELDEALRPEITKARKAKKTKKA